MNRTHRLVRHSQVRRLLHLLGGLEEPVLLPLLEPSRRRHAGPPLPLKIKSGTRHRTGFKLPAPPAAAPNPAAPPQSRGARPASEIPRGPSDQELCTPRKGRRLLASFRSRWEEAEAGRGRRRRRMGDATGRRRGEERRGEVGGSELLPSYIAASCWRCSFSGGFRMSASFFPTTINHIFQHKQVAYFIILFSREVYCSHNLWVIYWCINNYAVVKRVI